MCHSATNQIRFIISMKQEQPLSQSTLFRTCDICETSYRQASSSSIKICEKCRRGGMSMPSIAQESILQQEQIEEEPPGQLVSKMKKSSSRRYEAVSNKIGNYLDECMHLSNITNIDDDPDSDHSQEEHDKHARRKLEQSIREQQLKIKADKKIVIGSGFTFDMTDFFHFKKKKQLTSEQQGTVFEQISGSLLSWIILFFTVANSAIIPAWLSHIQSAKFIRQSWRFLMQTLILVPFVMHESRTASGQLKERYRLRYIFDLKNLAKPYVSSLASCLWLYLIHTVSEWTWISHGFVLGALSNFFLSIGRTLRSQNHHIQSGGQLLVTLGVVMLLQESVTLAEASISQSDALSMNTYFMRRTWWERVAADVVAILASLMMSQFSKFTSDLRNYYPTFLSMFIVNFFNVFHLSLIAFFLGSNEFGFQHYWGMLSVLSDQHITTFLYMAIVFACGQLITAFLIARMFPDPIIPALALTIDPYLASYFMQMTVVQNMPNGSSIIGFLLIFPGMIMILLGQCFFQRQKSYKQQSDKRVKRLLEEIKELHRMTENKDLRQLFKSKKAIARTMTMYQNRKISFDESSPRKL